MAQKIKVGAVSYLNTKPLIYGFEQGVMKDEIELVFDYPAKIALMLLDGSIDIGLVPVATLLSLKEHFVISDYGIACDGEVGSVCLFSEVPLTEIKEIILDYQSNTSVALLKILLREFWNLSPFLSQGSDGYESQIEGTTGGLIIGDRALSQRRKSKYVYDLGLYWKEMTGLPFVFATWVSGKKMSQMFTDAFNTANEKGLLELNKVISQNSGSDYDLDNYYRKCLKFKLNERMLEAKDLFLSKIESLQF